MDLSTAKHAFITGGASGLGLGMADAFLKRGINVTIADIDADALAAVTATRGNNVRGAQLDVRNREAWAKAKAEAEAAFGPVDILCCNAGISPNGREFADMSPESFDIILAINLGGVVNGCRAFARRLVERGTGGHIVNVASMAAYTPLSSLNAYCTSKAAVYMFSDCLRAELAASGVGLTTICPGVVNTNIVAATDMHAPDGRQSAVAGRRAHLQRMFELRNFSPEKVAEAILSAVRKNKPVRPVTPEAYLLYGASRIAPQALRSTARAKVL